MRNEKNFNEILKEAIKIVARKVFEESQLNIVKLGISDTGFLLRSGILLPTKQGMIINYSAPYAWQIEKGRMPGSMPPVEALEKWVRRKMQVPRKEQRKTAWAIAMKIKKYGTQPQPFIEPALLKVSKSHFRVEVLAL